MSFNKNSIKRLSVAAGANRISGELSTLINEIVNNYLRVFLIRLVNICNFATKKTINTKDIIFLTRLLPQDYPFIICGNGVSKLYTVKKPFNALVKEIIASTNSNIRISSKVIVLIQNMLEQYLINIISKAALLSNRETIFEQDVRLALQLN